MLHTESEGSIPLWATMYRIEVKRSGEWIFHVTHPNDYSPANVDVPSLKDYCRHILEKKKGITAVRLLGENRKILYKIKKGH